MLAFWRMGIAGLAAGALFTAALYCAAVLVRDTARQHWYWAAKITVAELLMAVGFDEDAPIEYRNYRGDVETISLHDLTDLAETRAAKHHILYKARESAATGGLFGFFGALAFLFSTFWLGWWDIRSERITPRRARVGTRGPEAAPHIAEKPASAKKPRKKRRRHHGRWA